MSREASVASEKQYLVRFPQDKADTVRQAIVSGQSLDERLQIECLSGSRGGLVRHAKVMFDGKLMHGKMMDLPCIVESHKTLDGKILYKTGDVSQMLVCTDITEEDMGKVEAELDGSSLQRESRKQFVANYGLTPPLKNVRKKRFRRTAPKKVLDMETPEVEREVRRLLREDLQAVNVSIDVVSDEKPALKGAEGEGGDEDGEDSYHGDLYAELQLTSSENSSDESPYHSSGDSADDHEPEPEPMDDGRADASGGHEAVKESAQMNDLRLDLAEVEQLIDNQEMRVRSQSNPFLKERFMQRLTDLKSRRETILAKMEDYRR
ncbi:transcription initiation factor TFIID subunit 7-like [Sycon ciliatum]|uniref:transcription initiation factor TFIID subunit 7-like n=1 Tax=Sycon ciliatum TaxID=27933 RepID=UPI0020A97A67|eukprot:scpid85628/ scgid28296/ Transcription initiation factor TFIID subunit 7; RNA polymerase II TBP-associated factor subunit F; Transcription initiation factor TFIID 55 kDa subunit